MNTGLTLMAELDASALKDTIVTQFAKSGPPGWYSLAYIILNAMKS
jgi:hypothetical protein